ncbi:MAG TPA: hypothetical protein VFI46_02465 [Jiangellaceae bacterium]|nr:hypothetical protein [Jiangellaceae bacterium]
MLRRVAARNLETRDAWHTFAGHREHLMSLIEGLPPGGRLGILGAGNCDDIDLARLLDRFEQVHLVDLDSEAVIHGVAASPSATRSPPPSSIGQALCSSTPARACQPPLACSLLPAALTNRLRPSPHTDLLNRPRPGRAVGLPPAAIDPTPDPATGPGLPALSDLSVLRGLGEP